MIYGRSGALRDLGVVVLDEVHFLQDTYRGPVWEEVIVHLPAPGAPGVPVGHGVERRGAGRLDDDRAGPDGGRRGAQAPGPPGEPLPGGRPLGRAAAPPAHAGRRPAQPRGQPARRRGGAGLAGQRPPAGPAPALHAAAGRGGGAPRRRGDAAGDLLHLQPGGVRRRRQGVLDAGAAPHHRRRARPDPRDRRPPPRRHRRPRPRRARLRPLPGRARGGHRRPPRRHGAAVQGGGRGVLHRRAGEGGVRHRDPRRRASTCRPARWSSRS